VSTVALYDLSPLELITVFLMAAVAFVGRTELAKNPSVPPLLFFDSFTFPLLEFPVSRSLSIEQPTSTLLSSWWLRSTADLLNGR